MKFPVVIFEGQKCAWLRVDNGEKWVDLRNLENIKRVFGSSKANFCNCWMRVPLHEVEVTDEVFDTKDILYSVQEKEIQEQLEDNAYWNSKEIK